MDGRLITRLKLYATFVAACNFLSSCHDPISKEQVISLLKDKTDDFTNVVKEIKYSGKENGNLNRSSCLEKRADESLFFNSACSALRILNLESLSWNTTNDYKNNRNSLLVRFIIYRSGISVSGTSKELLFIQDKSYMPSNGSSIGYDKSLEGWWAYKET